MSGQDQDQGKHDDVGEQSCCPGNDLPTPRLFPIHPRRSEHALPWSASHVSHTRVRSRFPPWHERQRVRNDDVVSRRDDGKLHACGCRRERMRNDRAADHNAVQGHETARSFQVQRAEWAGPLKLKMGCGPSRVGRDAASGPDQARGGCRSGKTVPARAYQRRSPSCSRTQMAAPARLTSPIVIVRLPIRRYRAGWTRRVCRRTGSSVCPPTG